MFRKQKEVEKEQLNESDSKQKLQQEKPEPQEQPQEQPKPEREHKKKKRKPKEDESGTIAEAKSNESNKQKEGKDEKEKKPEKEKKNKSGKEKEEKQFDSQTYSAPRSIGPYQLTDIDKSSESEDEEDDRFGDSFKDSAIRSKFIRKVYLILSVQLGFTTVFNIPFLHIDEVQEFIYDYPWLVFIALAVFVVPYFMLVCCESTRRSFPTNIILLFLMTLGMAGVCGYMTAKLDTEVVFYAFLLTVVVTLSITVLAIFCPFDFTKCLMVLCVVLIVFCVFTMIAVVIIIVTKSNVVNLVYAGICVVLFSLFLMFDTQAIIGGRRIRLSPEEYILAAIQIYVDIVEIFLNFLELIGACTEND